MNAGTALAAPGVGSVLNMAKAFASTDKLNGDSLAVAKSPTAVALLSPSTMVPPALTLSSGLPLNFPHPAGFTTSGDPYFAPPVNIPPVPAGYTEEMIPYYGKTHAIKAQPYGVTTEGVRFYSPDGIFGEGSRHQVAGYDNNGQPFYVPKGCTVPQPVGFTSDGIPYYDIPALMNHRGIMILPSFKAISPPSLEDDDAEDMDAQQEKRASSSELSLNGSQTDLTKKKAQFDPAEATKELLSTLKVTQLELTKTFAKGRPRLGKVERLNEVTSEKLQSIFEDFAEEDEYVNEPEDVVSYLRESEDFAYLKPPSIRVSLEPPILDFQSVTAAVNKSVVLRYRAGRGDHEERDVFISVEPVDIFTVASFHLRLQGEGVSQIHLTYNPAAMPSDKLEGSLSLIDESGKKLASCSLIALKQSFVKVTPAALDAGWVLPEKRKEFYLKLENVSPASISINMDLESEIESRQVAAAAAAILAQQEGVNVEPADIQDDIKSSPFILTTRSIKLQPGESKQLLIAFEPMNLGRFLDVLELHAPGGETMRITLSGIAGIPIALYPESAENSIAGSEALTRERCEFMKKFSRNEGVGEKGRIPLTDDDIDILQNMMSATADNDSRKTAHTLDFGICPDNSGKITRCVTIMNLSDSPLSLGLYPHHPALECKYLIKVPPRMAQSIQITLNVNTEAHRDISGNLKTAIEVVCPEFQNIPLNVTAFIGQPLSFNSWDVAFFKPCKIGYSEELLMTLTNMSQYEIRFRVVGLGDGGRNSETSNYFETTAAVKEGDESKILPYSLKPVSFAFFARQRGPLMSSVAIQIVQPCEATTSCTQSGRKLTLVGICMEPYLHKPDDPDKNGLDFLRMWISHPKRLTDEYPAEPVERDKKFDTYLGAGSKRNDSYINPDVQFKSNSVHFRQLRSSSLPEDDSPYRRAQVQQSQITNSSTSDIQTVYFASMMFNVEPRSRPLRRGDVVNCDIMFNPTTDSTENVTCFGFAVALAEHNHNYHSVSLIGKPASDFVVCPAAIKDQVVLDFGIVEVSSHTLDINVKSVMLCNTYGSSYSWSLKFVTTGKNKFNPFDAALTFGELQPYEAFSLGFKFHSDTSGTFEAIAEVTAKDAMDRTAKPVKIVNVLLRGQTVNTFVNGYPDTIDFGSAIVFKTKKKRFLLTNNGSLPTRVTLLTKSPFSVIPASFDIPVKGQQEVHVVFNPTESRASQAKLYCFSNQRLHIVSLIGSGGTADLICEKFDSRDIDFGNQREGTVAWMNLYLTNKGTLPLVLSGVTGDLPELVKIEFLNVTSTVPYEGNQSNTKSALVHVRPDYWSILRRKFKVFVALKTIVRKTNRQKTPNKTKRRGSEEFLEGGKAITVHRAGSVSLNAFMTPVVPQLRPFYSYHLRLGYVNKYQPRNNTDVNFHYMPITSEEGSIDFSSLAKKMTVRVVGHVFRPLEFFPTFHDFGLAPAEAWAIVKKVKETVDPVSIHYGVIKEGQTEKRGVFNLQVINMSLEPQNLHLKSINSEYTVNSRTWFVSPGEKLNIPIEFHPSKEQLQYHGEAVFSHNYGSQSIQFVGTGASADISADDSIDFGSLKLDSIGSYFFRLSNRGLLEGKYIFDIIQAGTEFRFAYNEPFEHEGIIGSGVSEIIEVQCCCHKPLLSKAHGRLLWERIPGGLWEEVIIPISVSIGVPMFKISTLEVDFKTTYINVNKTLQIFVSNDGNASCSWSAEPQSPLIIMDPESGIIEPGESTRIDVTYIPENYDPLISEINFTTDAGEKTIMCYGIVGVPYLMIPQDDLNVDFGIAAVNRTHTKAIHLQNTGTKHIQYEITMTELTQDGASAAPDEFEIFFANPTEGVIPPGQAAVVSIQAVPRQYNTTITAQFIIRTKDGERYIGRMSVTGGKAIIKIAPPKMTQPGVRAQTAEMKQMTPSSRDRERKSLTPTSSGMAQTPTKTSPVETARLAFQSHLENLQDILAGLRTAEMEYAEDVAVKERKRISESLDGLGNPNAALPPISGQRRQSRTIRAKITEDELLQRRLDEERKRSDSGHLVYDGSDLRSRVKQAASQSEKGRTASRGTSEGGEPSPLDEEDVQGTRTQSGRVRLKPLDGSDEYMVDSSGEQRRPARNSASAKRRQAALNPDHEKIEDSTAVNLLDDLATLEAELETISTALSTIVQGLSPQSGIGRYNPGTPRRLTHSRGKTAPSRGGTSSQGTNLFSLSEDGDDEEVIMFPRERTAPKETPKKGTPRRPLEDLVALAQQMLLNANSVVDPSIQKEMIEEINERLIESTKGVIAAVKDQLANEWIVNREFLTGALKRVQQTTHVMEAISLDAPEPEKLENDFDLGLIRSGDRTTDVMLFSLPNTGNLEFDFEMVPNNSVKISPPNQEDGLPTEFFEVTPKKGTVKPGETVQFSTAFYALTPGLYQQGYELKSDGDTVTTFTVTARLGRPIVKCEPGDIDFGLIHRNKKEVRTLIISNTGSFRDYWKLEIVRPQGALSSAGLDPEIDPFPRAGSADNDQNPFSFNVSKGELEPGDATTVQLKFHPTEEGPFNQKFRLIWGGEPQILEAKGVGGGARIKVVYMDPADVKFGGFDWGTCIVGVTYEKQFKITNVGNVDGHVHLAHARSMFRFEGPFSQQFNPDEDDSGGRHLKLRASKYNRESQAVEDLTPAPPTITVAPGEHIECTVFFTPEKTEVTKESAQIVMTDYPVQFIPLKATAGVRDWTIDGNLELKNMPMTEIQLQTLKITSTGGLDLPFGWKLELMDDTYRNILKVACKELKEAKDGAPLVMMKPKQTVNLNVTVTPKEHSRIRGTLTVSTDLGRGVVSRAFPFDFYAYAEQVALEDTKDINIGRLMMGLIADAGKSLTNFGAVDVKYRLRIEPIHKEMIVMSSTLSLGDDEPASAKGKKDNAISLSKDKNKRAKSKKLGEGSTDNLRMKIKSPWKIKGESEGVLHPNDSVMVEAVFECNEDHGEGWHEAKFIVEKCEVSCY
jgi:hypothetical protein